MVSPEQSISNHGGNVWYRRFLKPIIRKHRHVPLRESFRRRVIHSVGIPVHELQGFHQLFAPEYRHYSPLTGMIFTYNNFVDNLYRYGDPEEPAVQIIRILFHMLPGGDIQPTHLGSNPGAHLSAGCIGVILEALQAVCLAKLDSDKVVSVLVDTLVPLIANHPDYKLDRESLLEDSSKAEADLVVLEQKDADSKSFRQEIKSLEGEGMKRTRHKVKHLQHELSQLTKNASARATEERAQIEQQIADHEAHMGKTEQMLVELRTHIVTSLDFKVARKAVHRAQTAIELEHDGLASLMKAIACSLCTYDLDDSQPTGLPKYSTVAILLAYLWRKYDHIQALKGYFESMESMGALNCPMVQVEALLDHYSQHSSLPPDIESPVLRGHRYRRSWSPEDIVTAVIAATGKPGLVRRPPIIPFSYVKWAAYSEFPDCGETAIRNFINQLLYNPTSGKFDHELLVELRERYYPGMPAKFISFYTKNQNPQDAADQDVAVDWIEVVSKLNRGREPSHIDTVRYRREDEERNIASPLSNLMKVFNALFGIERLSENILPDVVKHINELRRSTLEVDTSGVKKDGFGIISLSDGKVRYELQSYKPVHFGFVLAEKMKFESSGRSNFEAFRHLKRYCCVPPKATPDNPAYFEQLALASLFVPYQLQRNCVGRSCVGPFFRSSPLHYPFLFADLNRPGQQRLAFHCTGTHPCDDRMVALADRMQNYEEPTFAPPGQAST